MIKFYRGLASAYNYEAKKTELQDVLYFCTDTNELFLNGDNYTIGANKLSDVEWDAENRTILFKRGGTGAQNLEVDLDKLLLTAADRTSLDNLEKLLNESGEFNALYNTAMDDEIATVTNLGGINAGTTAGSLKGKPISEVLDDLIFPTVQPVITEPSCTIALKDGVTDIKEIGDNAYTTADFNIGFNAGSIMVGSKKQNNRAGSAISNTIKCNNAAIPATVGNGTNKYTVTYEYSAGPQPLDSKGNIATGKSPLPAGSVTSKEVLTYGVFPVFARTEGAEYKKLSLTTSTTISAIKMVAENPHKHGFKIPAAWTLTAIKKLNPLSGNYEAIELSSFTATTVNETIQKQVVAYKEYVRNGTGFNGECTYEITFTK